MMVYAGFWKRFAAAIIDCIITSILGLIVAKILGTDRGKETMGIIGILVGWIYFACFESSSIHATVGKMALGIKVTGMNNEGIGFGKATGRHFGKILSAVILFIGFIMAAFTEKKQALHDKMAQCLVVNK